MYAIKLYVNKTDIFYASRGTTTPGYVKELCPKALLYARNIKSVSKEGFLEGILGSI